MNLKPLFLAGALLLAGITAAAAEPVLRGEVTVVSAIVTAGDMFDDAGEHAGVALFRSPAPGTSGTVSLEAVQQAAALAGIGDYAVNGVLRVRVARAATLVDAAMLTELITADLAARGIVHEGVTVEARFDVPDIAFNAEAIDNPASLVSLRYTPANGGFAARFAIAGIDAPADVTGRVELLVEAPHLAATRAAGTILSPKDIEMRLIPLRQAEGSGAASLDQLLGKQLTRQSRGGMLLRASDVIEPRVIERNAVVTVILNRGPMTLTVKGQALNAAAAGEPVQVLNPVSRRMLFGTAMPNGTVSISPTTAVDVAGL